MNVLRPPRIFYNKHHRRFALLNDYVSAYHRGLTNDHVLVQHVTPTKRVLKNLRVKRLTHPLFSKVAAGALYEEDDQVDVDDLSKLARENILTVDLATGLVSFNSRHVQTFFTETGVLWLLPLSTCA